jgi:hypothetical protein
VEVKLETAQLFFNTNNFTPKHLDKVFLGTHLTHDSISNGIVLSDKLKGDKRQHHGNMFKL